MFLCHPEITIRRENSIIPFLNKDIFKKQHDHDKPLKENEMKSEKMFE
jgi:hypothetical protein